MDAFSCSQRTLFAESVKSVDNCPSDVEAAQILCTLSAGRTAAKFLQQPLPKSIVPPRNVFDNPSFEEKSAVLVDRYAREARPLSSTVRREPQGSDQTSVYFPGNEHTPTQPMLDETELNFLGRRQSIPQGSLFGDSIHHRSLEVSDQDRIVPFSGPVLPIAITTPPQSINKQFQRSTHIAEDTSDLDSSASAGSGESLTIYPDKVSVQSYKSEASVKPDANSDEAKELRKKASKWRYEQSQKGKETRKRYRKKGKCKEFNWNYNRSPGGKASVQAYREAYFEAFKKAGSREKARIAGKHATALIRESSKQKKVNSIDVRFSPPRSFPSHNS